MRSWSNTQSRSQLANLCWGLTAFVLPFVAYLRTLAPTVYGLDSAELTTGAYTLGIVHTPGSPLYLLLGHLFTRLPFGDVGYRMNLMSAVFAALAALFAFLILDHLTHQRFLALMSAWILAFSYYFWISAVAAELYAPAAFFVTALIWLALKWREESKLLYLNTLALLFGMGLGNHMSLILLAPGLAWLVLTVPTRSVLTPRTFIVAALFGSLGACVFLYLPWRYLSDARLNYARDYWHINLATWDGFVWMVSARMFSSSFFAVPIESLPAQALMFLYRLWSNFLGLGFLIGLAGLFGDFRRRTSLHIGLVLMFLGHLAFYIPYTVSDKDLMFLPTYVIWGLWVGMGLNLIHDRLIMYAKGVYNTFVPVLSLGLVIASLGLNFSYADVSQDWSARTRGEDILTTMEPHALFVGSWGDVPIIEYLQIVEDQRPDVETMNLVFTGEKVAGRMVREKLLAGIPVYTSMSWLGTEEFELEEIFDCPCYKVVKSKSARRDK